MRIEIAKEGRMDMSGQGLIRAIQNNNMPILDLLVRESVQNSLDAACKDAKFVNVDFGVSNFSNRKLTAELEGIENELIDKFGESECKYLYIKDSNTKGLTGPLHFTDISENEEKNLLKLVYEIAKPQENKGAGGSWGYGKTIYFRVGIGLVIYYSRIKLDDGTYQSRLAACLVEDEKKEDALLGNPQLNSKRGLAWWGKEFKYYSNGVEEKGTIPEINEDKIEDFLSIFGIRPFRREETGTTIIIPYIDEKKLLSNNISSETVLPWGHTVKDYIEIAVQRWYIGRLNNERYTEKQKQPWLRVTIDEVPLGQDDMATSFRNIQKLYNMALLGQKTDSKSSMNDYHCEQIRINSFFKSPTAGYVAYKMFTPEELGMNPPENSRSPFIYVKNEDGTDDYKDGDIIITYFRKPGMAVTYDTCGEWVNKIKCNNEKTGDVLIAVFVLNSSNKFDYSGINELDTIEEYFRASERADHTAWYDINVNDINPRLLLKIQKGIRNKINKTFTVKEEKKSKASSLSNVFGEYFLPPEGFGHKANGIKGGKSGSGETIKHKNIRLILNNNKIRLEGNHIFIPLNINATAPVEGKVLGIEVSADGKNITIPQWEDRVGIDVPFYIESFEISRIQSESKTLEESITLDISQKEKKGKSFSLTMVENSRLECYGIKIFSDLPNLQISAEMKIKINDATAKMAYVLKDGE